MRNLITGKRSRRLAIAAALATIGSTLVVGFVAQDAQASLADTLVRVDGVGYPGAGPTSSLDIEVFDETTIGNTVFVAGKFTKIYDSVRKTWVDQRYLAAFDGTTGRYLPWFRPVLEGPAYAVQKLGDKLLVGGEFKSVDNMPETNSLALIDPTTAQVDPQWISSPSNGTARAKVNDIFISGSTVYLAGNFRTITGGTPATAIRSNGYTGLARIRASDGRPDETFKPVVVGPVWTVAVSTDGQRIHVGGNFESVNGQGPTLATLRVSDATPIAGWDNSKPSAWGNLGTRPDYWRGHGWAVFDIDVYGDMLWIGGAEHGYAAKSSATGQTIVNRVAGHDSQRVKIFDGRVYIGCHCHAYLTGNITSDLPFFELDATTGASLSTFSRYLEGADAGWAITKTPDGCMWPGGDFRAGRDSAGNRVFVAGFTKICDVTGPIKHSVPGVTNNVKPDTAAPTTPGAVKVVAAGGFPRLTWTASTDDRPEVAYRIYRDGLLVGSTRTLSYTDSVAATEAHSWVVIAVDGEGKVSVPAAAVVLAGGAAAHVSLLPPTEAGPLARYEQRVQFSLDAPASNVAYVEAAVDGKPVERFYSDRLQPLSNVALGSTARMSSVVGTPDLKTLVDGTCCNTPNIDTTVSANPWVEVDLGKSYDIEGVDRMLNSLFGGVSPMVYFMLRETPFTGTDPVAAAADPATTSVKLYLPGVTLSQQIVGRGRYVRLWASCTSCFLRLTEMRVWGGNVRAPLNVSIPGGAGTYTFRNVGIDGTKSDPLTYVVGANTPYVTADWNSTIDIAATQSSTRQGAVAERALDGNIDGNFAANTSSVTNAAATRNLARLPGVTTRSMAAGAIGTPAAAVDGNTNGAAAGGSVFVSPPGSGAATNLLRAAGVTVSSSNTVDGHVPQRAVDGTTDGSDAAASTATAGPGAGGAGTPTNWARQPGATVAQSSDFSATTPASAAVDGNTVTAAGTYSYTARGSAGWMRLDLGAERPISDIQLWPRTDDKWWFAARMKVFVSSVPFTGTTEAALAATPGVTSFDVTSTPKQGQQFPVGRTGRYVFVLRTEADSLSLTEIAVNGTVTTGATAYWQADLGAAVPLQGMRLWSRTGCCSAEGANARVLFSTNPFTSDDINVVSKQAGVTTVDVAQIGNGTPVVPPASARYVRVQKTDTGNLSLAEAELTGPTARQWWETDLGSNQPITTIDVSPRTDCCATQSGAYWVFVSPTPFVGNSPEAAMAKADTATFSVDAAGPAHITVNTGGRYVRVQKKDAEALALAEVAVISVDAPSWWQADLGQVRDLRSVRLYPRTDCCGTQSTNIRIMYSDTPIVSADPAVAITQAGVTYRDVTAPVTVGQSFYIGRRARYVRIQKLDSYNLTLAEVKLNGRQP